MTNSAIVFANTLLQVISRYSDDGKYFELSVRGGNTWVRTFWEKKYTDDGKGVYHVKVIMKANSGAEYVGELDENGRLHPQVGEQYDSDDATYQSIAKALDLQIGVNEKEKTYLAKLLNDIPMAIKFPPRMVDIDMSRFDEIDAPPGWREGVGCVADHVGVGVGVGAVVGAAVGALLAGPSLGTSIAAGAALGGLFGSSAGFGFGLGACTDLGAGLGGGGGGCFPGHTLVATKNGAREISSLSPGDKVFGFDLSRGICDQQFVKKSSKHSNRKVVAVKMSGETLLTTADHPFYTGIWTHAGDLKVGDRIERLDGSWETVCEQPRDHGVRDVFNISVEPSPTYYVGEGRVLVHNKDVSFDEWVYRMQGSW